MLAANVNILHSQNLRSPPAPSAVTHSPPSPYKTAEARFSVLARGPFMSRPPDIETKKLQNSANLLREAFVRRGTTVHFDDN